MIGRQTCSTYNIILDHNGICVVQLDYLFLRIGTIWTPPIGAFHIARKRLKWDAYFANSTVAVDFGLALTARIAVVAVFCGGAVGDEGFECREAAYYHS